jgi:NAD-dependent dihydropyrimidine dehydrogenase PreA subunit
MPSCAEGALKISGGKAKLVSDKYCDGLGACLGECPRGAISIEERTADDFSENAAKQHKENSLHKAEERAYGCPSVAAREIDRKSEDGDNNGPRPSQLRHWPVQLTLLSPTAHFLKNADIILAADCTAYAYAGFHRDFLRDHVLIIACPKLDDFAAHLEKLTQITVKSALKSMTVVHMEVPCCSGLVFMAKKAIEAAGKEISFKEITIGIDGGIK